MSHKFWMVGKINANGKLSSLPHDQYSAESDARVHAEEAARANPHDRFVVLEAIDTVRKSDIAWEPCYENLPF